MKKFILFLFTILFVFSNLQAQNNLKSILRKANKELSNRRYNKALPLFKKYLLYNSKDIHVLNSVSSIYVKQNLFDSALVYTSLASKIKGEDKDKLAELYAMTNQQDKASNVYKEILENKRTKLAESRFYGFTNLNKFYADSLDYKVYNSKINTKYKELNSIIFNGGVIFESNRVDIQNKSKKNLRASEFALGGAGYNRLFYQSAIDSIASNSTNAAFKNSKMVSAFYDKNFYIGAISITADGKKAYYTKSRIKKTRNLNSEIWESVYKNGAWVNHKRMFFNRPGHNYFQPAITSDGKRLYYVSDDPATSKGGADIYYIDQNEDGSWKSTTNVGDDINTAGDELYPTFYEGNFYFSSNGHPGLGGLDIYRVTVEKGKVVVKNMGYPINSAKDDFGFNIKSSKGFLTSNRLGSDDILSFEYKKMMVKVKGNVLLDGNCEPGRTVFLKQKFENGTESIVDSTIVDANCKYEFDARPNQNYSLVIVDKAGGKYEQSFVADGYENSNLDVKGEAKFEKSLNLFNVPSKEKEILAQLAQEKLEREQEEASMGKYGKLTIDSLQKLTKDFVVLHHPFDNVYVIDKDLSAYYKLIERVKRMQNKRIVIVSATDCTGAEQYNEDLSNRRAARVYKTLSKLSNNEVVIKNVGERELLKDCDEQQRDHSLQLENRYSYVFIIDKK